MGIKQDYQHILDDERLSDFEKNNIYVLTNGNVVVIDEDGERRGLFGNGQHTVWLDFENHEKLGDMTKLSDLIRIDDLETALREIKRVAEAFPQDKAILKITERVLGGA